MRQAAISGESTRRYNMRTILSIQQTAEYLLLSRASFYRLAANGLLPKPIRFSSNRSGVFEDEINSVITARASGSSTEDIRNLVSRLHRDRKAFSNNKTTT